MLESAPTCMLMWEHLSHMIIYETVDEVLCNGGGQYFCRSEVARPGSARLIDVAQSGFQSEKALALGFEGEPNFFRLERIEKSPVQVKTRSVELAIFRLLS